MPRPIQLTHQQRRDRRREIADMVRRTSDVNATARHFGVTRATVMDACREHGVEPRSKNE